MDAVTDWANPAAWYDVLNPWGPSDDFYLDLVMSAGSVLDVGCGTGTLLHRARDAGHTGRLCGLDPDPAMLDRARARSDIEWVLADAASAVWDREFDLAVMASHAFQELIGDNQLRRSLRAIRAALRDGGRFAFETRHPQARAWEGWNTSFEARNPDGDVARVSYRLQEVTGDLVRFTETLSGRWWDRPQVQHGTLRFLDPEALAAFLHDAGFVVDRQYGDWRPGPLTDASEEIITIARRGSGSRPLGYHARVRTREVRMAPGATAAADALAAASAAGVEVRELHDPAELRLVQRLFEEIWRPAPDSPPPVTAELLRALAHAGNYVAGAWAGERLAGACMGFLSAPGGAHGGGRALHSHIAGVAPGTQRRGVGFALKLHQRAWALDRGLPLAIWTFDPLVARNAWFNLAKLGADADEYLPDFYGPMNDAINAGDASDRLLVAWRLDDPKVAAACAGSPAEPDPEALRAAGAQLALDQDADGLPVAGKAVGPVLLVRVPDDVEGLRAGDPAAASRWRHAVREVLGGLLAEGATVTGFARSGCYVVRRAQG